MSSPRRYYKRYYESQSFRQSARCMQIFCYLKNHQLKYANYQLLGACQIHIANLDVYFISASSGIGRVTHSCWPQVVTLMISNMWRIQDENNNVNMYVLLPFVSPPAASVCSLLRLVRAAAVPSAFCAPSLDQPVVTPSTLHPVAVSKFDSSTFLLWNMATSNVNTHNPNSLTTPLHIHVNELNRHCYGQSRCQPWNYPHDVTGLTSLTPSTLL